MKLVFTFMAVLLIGCQAVQASGGNTSLYSRGAASATRSVAPVDLNSAFCVYDDGEIGGNEEGGRAVILFGIEPEIKWFIDICIWLAAQQFTSHRPVREVVWPILAKEVKNFAVAQELLLRMKDFDNKAVMQSYVDLVMRNNFKMKISCPESTWPDYWPVCTESTKQALADRCSWLIAQG